MNIITDIMNPSFGRSWAPLLTFTVLLIYYLVYVLVGLTTVIKVEKSADVEKNCNVTPVFVKNIKSFSIGALIITILLLAYFVLLMYMKYKTTFSLSAGYYYY
jgi:hypothetical protein